MKCVQLSEMYDCSCVSVVEVNDALKISYEFFSKVSLRFFNLICTIILAYIKGVNNYEC